MRETPLFEVREVDPEKRVYRKVHEGTFTRYGEACLAADTWRARHAVDAVVYDLLAGRVLYDSRLF